LAADPATTAAWILTFDAGDRDAVAAAALGPDQVSVNNGSVAINPAQRR